MSPANAVLLLLLKFLLMLQNRLMLAPVSANFFTSSIMFHIIMSLFDSIFSNMDTLTKETAISMAHPLLATAPVSILRVSWRVTVDYFICHYTRERRRSRELLLNLRRLGGCRRAWRRSGREQVVFGEEVGRVCVWVWQEVHLLTEGLQPA